MLLGLLVGFVVKAQCPEQIVVNGKTYIKIDTWDELLALKTQGEIEIIPASDGTTRQIFIFKAGKRMKKGKKSCAKGRRGCLSCPFIKNADGTITLIGNGGEDENYYYSSQGDVFYYCPENGDVILLPCGQ